MRRIAIVMFFYIFAVPSLLFHIKSRMSTCSFHGMYFSSSVSLSVCFSFRLSHLEYHVLTDTVFRSNGEDSSGILGSGSIQLMMEHEKSEKEKEKQKERKKERKEGRQKQLQCLNSSQFGSIADG